MYILFLPLKVGMPCLTQHFLSIRSFIKKKGMAATPAAVTEK
jgi:hypothetical protein